MAKKKEATVETPVQAAPVTEKQISKKIPKLAKKNKRRLPRKEKKAAQKAALKNQV